MSNDSIREIFNDLTEAAKPELRVAIMGVDTDEERFQKRLNEKRGYSRETVESEPEPSRCGNGSDVTFEGDNE